MRTVSDPIVHVPLLDHQASGAVPTGEAPIRSLIHSVVLIHGPDILGCKRPGASPAPR